jgi:signal transduction histidine kinase
MADKTAKKKASKASEKSRQNYHEILKKSQAELALANGELASLNCEKEKRVADLILAKGELAFQNDEKAKRAAELLIANKELVFQNKEIAKLAEELVIANEELAFQNTEKEKRAIELAIAHRELGLKIKQAAELVITNGELVFQNGENGKRAVELATANVELAFQISEKRNRAEELLIANRELIFQNDEKEKRAAELLIANEELVFQNKEKGKRAAELLTANIELIFQNSEKEKRAAELVIANAELAFQNAEKGKRAAELLIANSELAFQNSEREKRAAELVVANNELVFQNGEKEKRAAELALVNEELEAFSYVSSHDLQEPLRKIQTLSNRVVEIDGGNLSIKGKEYLERMQSAAARMRLLIDDLLAFSRLTRAERKFEYTDLNKIIGEVKNELREVIEEKGVTIDVITLCAVNIIPFQFRQIMYNLLNNALKFSKPDLPLHIVIKSEIHKGIDLNEAKLLPETTYCHISISDNGIGFDEAYKDRIFDVFQRLHGTTHYPGSGIGLAIVKKAVDNHNGVVNATGILNKGATFNIYLPVSQENV